MTLVAGSSTGKTRACWEAVQRLPPEWRLWHSIDPGYPDAALAEPPRVGPRTVVWVNEAQFYLALTDAGERIAAGLRELLRDRGRRPVPVPATLWPEYWATLPTTQAPRETDPHAQARALLAGTDTQVPDAFEGRDLDALRTAAGSDPRLAQALSNGDRGRITQYLAGAPALIERYRNARDTPGTGAVIEAAMDARRLGHGPLLRRAFLEYTAEAYLTDEEFDNLDDEWFEQALAYTEARCHGATAILTRTRTRKGRAPSGTSTYRLADYLEQHARRTRRVQCPKAPFWDAALDHAHTPTDWADLGHAADSRLRLRHAERLLGAAAGAGAGDIHVLQRLAGMRGDHTEAERLAHEAYDGALTGPDFYVLTRLTVRRENSGDRA